MSDQAVEILINQCDPYGFHQVPRGDGGPKLDYEWIALDQSVHIARAILQDLAVNISDRKEGKSLAVRTGCVDHGEPWFRTPVGRRREFINQQRWSALVYQSR